MTPADPLTPEEVERLDPETRRYYSGANSRDESMWPTVLIVSRDWLRDHITRAARMEAATSWRPASDEPPKMTEVLATLESGDIVKVLCRGNTYWTTVPGKWNVTVVAWMPLPVAALAPAERSK